MTESKTRTPGDEARVPWRFARFAWFAGANRAVLARTPSEVPFYSALGMTAVLLSVMNGAALCIAMGYMFGRSPMSLWWAGLGWAVILSCGIERLVLQIFVARRWQVAVVLVPRVVLSLMLAVQIAEPATLRMLQPEITQQLDQTHASASKAARDAAKASYDGEVEEHRREIKATADAGQALHDTYVEARQLSGCAATLAICATGHGGTCDAMCQGYVAKAKQAHTRWLLGAEGRRAGNKSVQKDIRDLKKRKKDALTKQLADIEADSGLLAREQALTQLRKADPSVGRHVWFWRLFWVSLDLVPLSMKSLRLLTGSAYEDNVAAARRLDGLYGKWLQATAKVEEQRIADQARADIAANRRRIRERADDGEPTASHGWRAPEPPPGPPDVVDEPIDVGAGDSVPAMSLSRFAGVAREHERFRIDVPQPVRYVALLGLGCIVTAAGVMTAVQTLGSQALTGTWPTRVLLVLVAALTVYTSGFRRAPAWALRASFATLLVGLLLPVAILGLNASRL